MTDVIGSEPEPGIVSVTWKSQGRQCPALRMGNTIAWLNRESQLVVEGVDRHHAAQRHFLLLDLGVKMAVPNEWVERGDPLWYVDLVIWEQHGERFDIVDLDIDLFVPTDGRPYRMLDLDEFADAVEAGEFSIGQALDGLRRWQDFLDRHIHVFGPKDVDYGWLDFPPKAIAALQRLPDEAFPRSSSS